MNDTINIAGFPITPDVVLKKKGTYKGINYEITNHARSHYDFMLEKTEETDGIWCYYIYVSENQLSKKDFKQFWLKPIESTIRNYIHYDYMNTTFALLPWHCGITFYEKHGGFDGHPKCVKLGCDYNHYWDENRYYKFDNLERDVKETIDSLISQYKFLVRCPYFGTYHDESEMVLDTQKNILYSIAGMEEINKNRNKTENNS